MQAVIGQEAFLDHERQPRKLLADLEVTTKTVERTAADATGPDIAAREQEEIQRAVQLDLPMVDILALRCCYANGQFEGWEAHRAA